jgi:hypothetical protein
MTDFMHDFSINVIFKTMSPMHSKQQKLKFSYYITMADWPRRAMAVNTRGFFYHYTRRFFPFKITLAVFFFRITRDVFSMQ